VVALMQKHSARPVKTFSIGFAEAAFNEAPHARAVAAHLGCEHTELTVSPADLLAVVPDIPRHWDEPFADSSQIPTYILSRLTRQHVTVSLSGDGGDELFSGYERYPWALRAHRMLSHIPAPLRRAALGLARLLPDAAYGLLGARGHKLRWRVDALAIEDFRDLYWHAISHFKDPARFVLGAREPGYEAAGLPPLADKGAWMSVPTAMKVQGGQGKWLLRQVLYRHVPRELVERPKMGFGVPIAAWLRGELRQWADDLLSPAAIRRQGYLDAGRVERMWREYLAGEDNWNYYLWDVLMFQAWLEMWGKPD
jgi:asparagine synthase (glutamine-hydrolysing)